MSIPRNHHFLPKFYIERWARHGKIYRFVRPRGPNWTLDCKQKSPKAIAYERDLYHLPDIGDPLQSQSLELVLFQRIDSQASVALDKLDRLENGSASDRNALSQFMISLLHRSPSRLAAIRTELANQTEGAPYQGLEGVDFDHVLKSTANRLLAMLVESAETARRISMFKAFRIDVKSTSKTLLTSDRPITVSAQLIASDAFMILPYAPDRLLILTHQKQIADAFSSQDPDALVTGINEAVVEQAQEIVIGADKSAIRMIDRLFLRPQPGRNADSIGLIRRKAPLISLQPQIRKFSRHDKKGMKYLGR